MQTRSRFPDRMTMSLGGEKPRGYRRQGRFYVPEAAGKVVAAFLDYAQAFRGNRKLLPLVSGGTIMGVLPLPTGKGGRLVSVVRAAGPASYATGGFTVDTTLSVIDTGLTVQADDERELAATDNQYAINYTSAPASGTSTTTIKVYVCAAAAAWAETAAAGNYSGIHFVVTAYGYNI